MSAATSSTVLSPVTSFISSIDIADLALRVATHPGGNEWVVLCVPAGQEDLLAAELADALDDLSGERARVTTVGSSSDCIEARTDLQRGMSPAADRGGAVQAAQENASRSLPERTSANTAV